jgi:hypothetical protein
VIWLAEADPNMYERNTCSMQHLDLKEIHIWSCMLQSTFGSVKSGNVCFSSCSYTLGYTEKRYHAFVVRVS